MLIANITSLASGTTTGTGSALDLRRQGSVHLTFTVKTTNATVSAGAVTFEQADVPDYAGTWQVILSPLTPVANSEVTAHVEGGFGAVRMRVSTTITGGATVQGLIRATSHGD